MEPSVITFIMNGKTYRISPHNLDAIRLIPKQDREQLIALLESVKLQDRLSASVVEQAAARVGVAASATSGAMTTNTETTNANAQPVKAERLGKGDVDDLMARLIMEEKRNKKPGLTRETIYKWAAGFIAAIFLLVILF